MLLPNPITAHGAITCLARYLELYDQYNIHDKIAEHIFGNDWKCEDDQGNNARPPPSRTTVTNLGPAVDDLKNDQCINIVAI
jgi:hypothetical protein